MSNDLHCRLMELEEGTDGATALAFYDSLPAAKLDQVTGSWRGRGLPTGHVLDRLLEQYGWHGKRFDSAEDVHPLIFAGEKGRLFSVDPSRVPVGMLVANIKLAKSTAAKRLFRTMSGMLTTRKPRARLRMTEYRGLVTATMIYDSLPINDVFRAVDPDTLLGAMDMRGFEQPFMFTLRRETTQGIH